MEQRTSRTPPENSFRWAWVLYYAFDYCAAQYQASRAGETRLAGYPDGEFVYEAKIKHFI